MRNPWLLGIVAALALAMPTGAAAKCSGWRLLIVMNNDLPNDASQIHVSFNHYASCAR
jgi:hypothetical protein